MESNPVFETVKELLRQGDTGQALDVLIQYLEKETSHPEFLQTLQVVASNFNATRQQELKGILEFSEARREYAKSNDAILSILEDLKAGKKSSGINQLNGVIGARKTQFYWILGGGAMILIGLIAGIYFSQAPAATKEVQKPASSSCPSFRSAGFKVMVLEFQKLSGEDTKPELGIQTRIRDLTERNQVNTDVKILPSSAFDGSTPGNVEARALGSQCQADMVIWGQYEKMGDSLSVDIRYTFTDPTWPPGIAQETFKNVSELKTDQMKINNLDDAVFRLCTAMALHQNKMDLAQKWLNKIQKPNAREIQWKNQLEK